MTSHAVKVKEILKPGEKVPLMFDECAKIMFANPNHLEPLILLLSKVLRVEYDDLVGKVELAPTNMPNNIIGAKKTNRDIVVNLKEEIKNKIVIEVNISQKCYETITNKSLYYMFETAGSGLKENEKYDKVEPTFLICFNTFFVDEIHNKIFDEYYFRNDEGYILTTKEKILEINIAECYSSWYNGTYKALTNIYQKDLLLLGAAMYTKEIEEFNRCIEEISINKNIKIIMEEVSSRMSEDEEIKVRYYDFLEETRRLNDSIISDEKRKARKEGLKEGIKEGIKQGMEKGIEQGIERSKREMIINMYADNLPLPTISKYSKLSIEEIEKIIKEYK